jgi:UDPglucose--hexose-1-phosphate uridylyltransferase
MPSTKSKSEFRKHYFLDKYVLITPGRLKRPRDIREETILDKTSSCVFCPDKIEKRLIVDYCGAKTRWFVMVLKNKFSAVSTANDKAYGIQEVVIETPEHGLEMGDLSVAQIELVLEMYAKRIKAIQRNKKINYILIFKNSGSKAGASLHHSHSQIFATELLPPIILEDLTEEKRYSSKNGICPFCAIINKEQKSRRLILENKEIVVIAPYASEYHYEAWLMTRRHLDNITDLNENEIRSLAVALKKILGKLRSLGLSYNFSFEQIVNDREQHFCLKIQPRDSVWAGVEMNSGLIINSVPPEEAAKFYR